MSMTNAIQEMSHRHARPSDGHRKGGGDDDGDLNIYRQQVHKRFGGATGNGGGRMSDSEGNRSNLSSFSFTGGQRPRQEDRDMTGGPTPRDTRENKSLMSRFGLSGWSKPVQEETYTSSDEDEFDNSIHLIPEEKKVEEAANDAEEFRPWRRGTKLWATSPETSGRKLGSGNETNTNAKKQDDQFDAVSHFDVMSQFDVGRWQEVDNDTVFVEKFGDVWDDATFTPDEQKGRKYTYSAGKVQQRGKKYTYSAGKVSTSSPKRLSQPEPIQEEPSASRHSARGRRPSRKKSEYSLQETVEVSYGDTTVPTSNRSRPNEIRRKAREGAEQPQPLRRPMGNIQNGQRFHDGGGRKPSSRFGNNMPPLVETETELPERSSRHQSAPRRSRSKDAYEDAGLSKYERRSSLPVEHEAATRHRAEKLARRQQDGGRDRIKPRKSTRTKERDSERSKPHKSERSSEKTERLKRIKDTESTTSSRRSDKLPSSKTRRSSRQSEEDSSVRRKSERSARSKDKISRRKSADGDEEVRRRSSRIKARDTGETALLYGAEGEPVRRKKEKSSPREKSSRKRSSKSKHSAEVTVKEVEHALFSQLEESGKKKKTKKSSRSEHGEERSAKKKSSSSARRHSAGLVSSSEYMEGDAPRKSKKKSSKVEKSVKSGLSKKKSRPEDGSVRSSRQSEEHDSHRRKSTSRMKKRPESAARAARAAY